MKFKLFLKICLSLNLLAIVAAAQIDPIKKAETQLLKWTGQYPQEKVYLHFDKPYYATGDDIWFKAYITVGPKHELSALSGALNVELIDNLDSVKQVVKLPIVAGTAFGDFALSDTLAAGNYRIRAYTNWMRNFGTAYFFDKTITIGSAAANNVYTKAAYTYNTQGGQQSTTATISFTDINGSTLPNKEVNYQVLINDKNVERGKGITDGKGNWTLSFTNPPNVKFKEGKIIARIKTDAKTTRTKEIPIKAVSSSVDVQFFPESGNLVYGLPSKVAFKAIAADGLGSAVTGSIVGDDNTEVAKIETQHSGMGAFILVPAAGRSYKAKLSFADGSQRTLSLPIPLQQGYVLSVNANGDEENVIVKLFASADLKGTEVNVVAQAGGSLCYAAKSVITNGVISAKIPKTRFPRGIVQFTVFNAASNALNERLVFIDKPDELKLDVSVPKPTYKTREKVTVNIGATTTEDKGAVSSLSAAVIDNTRVPVTASDETTILSSLLLSGDIKGYIEQPNYYFENINAKTRNDLDILMLTQGYRRFEWKEIMADNLPALTFPPEKSITISGRVHTGGNKPVVGGKVSLFANKGAVFYIDTLTDKDGRFAFKNLIFRDSLRFVIQARTAKDKKFVDIDLDNTTPQIVTVNPNLPDESINDTTLSYLQSSKKFYEQQLKSGTGNHNILLKEVIIREKREPLKNSSNRNGPGEADQVLKSDVFENMSCPNLVSCLQGRILGVTFINNVPYSRGSPMKVYVDGFPVDADFLSTLNQYDIGSIEVLRSIGYSAIYGATGVLLINTKRGNEGYTVNRYTPGLITYRPRGFYQARQFYSPQYDSPGVNMPLADLRTTIFWKPNVITGTDGKTSIEYFNAGSPGTYRIVVEGIDADGHIGRKVLKYKVE